MYGSGRATEKNAQKKTQIMVFKNGCKKLKTPFVIYADFACLTTKPGTVSTKELKTDPYHITDPAVL